MNGKRFRQSVGLRDWARAVKRVEQWEAKPQQAGAVVNLDDCVRSYLGDCHARNLADSTIRSYTKTLAHLAAFCASRGIRGMDGIDLGMLTDFRAGRKVEPSTSGKELETLRAFCAFCKKRAWMVENYAKDLEPPQEDGPPTLPFASEEVEAILEACAGIEGETEETRERRRKETRALCLLMLYSGLRISDAVMLKTSAVDLASGKLLLRVMKTGAPLYVRLRKPATEALEALNATGEYFFWNGASKRDSATEHARRNIYRAMAIAGVPGHPHRFRDTFSVSLLEKGEALHTVQLLLGHTSIKTTEKHYAPYVESFQRILDAATSKLDFGTRIGTREKHAAKVLKIG
jgi:site-specific recombinase XerD